MRNLQERVAAADGEGSEIVVHQQRAGIDAAQLKVVVEVPLGVGVAAGGDPQARDQRRKMPRLGDEGDAGQIFCGGEDVALSGDQRSAEGRDRGNISAQTSQVATSRTSGAGNAGLVLQIADALPGNGLFRRGGADREAGHGRFALLNCRRRLLRVEPGHESVFDFVGVAQNVALVEVQNIARSRSRRSR